MYSIEIENMNLKQIADSGQCFRWKFMGDNTYSIIAFGKYIEVSQDKNTFVFSCDEEEFKNIWESYFDLSTDYKQIKENIKEDVFLYNAIQYGSGIRILKQELWETIISFIISQRKSIPAIKKCIELLCEKYGTPIYTESYKTGFQIKKYTFPTVEQFANATKQELRECGVGYRDVYILDAIKQFYDLRNVFCLSYTEMKAVLKNIHGIGDKVANCICLFSLHMLQACPIDVWMQKIIDEEYFGVIPKWMNNQFAGVFQQYAFYYKKNKKITIRR